MICPICNSTDTNFVTGSLYHCNKCFRVFDMNTAGGNQEIKERESKMASISCIKCGSLAVDKVADGYVCSVCKATWNYRPILNPLIYPPKNGTMTFEQFDNYQLDLLTQVKKMKDTKGKEYAHYIDRFANFNRLADRLSQSNLLIAWVYLTKHLDSIESYIKDGKVYSTESIQGRIVDAITYLTLIGGMIEANQEKPKNGGAYERE